jgi:hypothetical protein
MDEKHSFEGSLERRERGEGARKLHELEQSGKFVFHGSPDGEVTEFEPRQMTTYVDDVQVKDGPPGIATTPHADLAIFHALTKDRGEGNTNFGTNDDGSIYMKASQAVLDATKDHTAYVYVFPRSAFAPRYGDDQEMERRSEVNQRPVQVVAVTDRDLPPDINIIP